MNAVPSEHLGYAVQYIDDTVTCNGDRRTPAAQSVDDHLDKILLLNHRARMHDTQGKHEYHHAGDALHGST